MEGAAEEGIKETAGPEGPEAEAVALAVPDR